MHRMIDFDTRGCVPMPKDRRILHNERGLATSDNLRTLFLSDSEVADFNNLEGRRGVAPLEEACCTIRTKTLGAQSFQK
jgi:hypothetical protein